MEVYSPTDGGPKGRAHIKVRAGEKDKWNQSGSGANRKATGDRGPAALALTWTARSLPAGKRGGTQD